MSRGPRHVFFGHEERVAAGTSVFVHSVLQHAREPLALTPITRMATRGIKEGTNAFTYRRFLVPWAMGWTGLAIFVDGSDMLCRTDISELFAELRPGVAVQVVKHEYTTRHPRKYVGTAMEADNIDYPRKQWASVMLINCGHFAWRKMDPEYVAAAPPLHLLQFEFLEDKVIGELPMEWNWLADEQGENPNAKILHWTAGVPGIAHYNGAPMSAEWHAALAAASKITG